MTSYKENVYKDILELALKRQCEIFADWLEDLLIDNRETLGTGTEVATLPSGNRTATPDSEFIGGILDMPMENDLCLNCGHIKENNSQVGTTERLTDENQEGNSLQKSPVRNKKLEDSSNPDRCRCRKFKPKDKKAVNED